MRRCVSNQNVTQRLRTLYCHCSTTALRRDDSRATEQKIHCWHCSVRRRNKTMRRQHRKRTASPHHHCWHRNNYISNACKCQAVPPHAQTMQRTLPRFEAGARKLWVVRSRLRSLYPRERGTVPTVQEAGWSSETFWMGLVKSLLQRCPNPRPFTP